MGKASAARAALLLNAAAAVAGAPFQYGSLSLKSCQDPAAECHGHSEQLAVEFQLDTAISTDYAWGSAWGESWSPVGTSEFVSVDTFPQVRITDRVALSQPYAGNFASEKARLVLWW